MKTVVIGEIVKPHGIKGELRVYPLTHDPSRFKKLSQVTLMKGGQSRLFSVIGARVQSGMVYLSLDGISSIEDVEKYRGWEIHIDPSEVQPLPEGEWYHFELEGMAVYEGETHLGTLTSVLETGANDVYLVNGKKGEICIPALKSVVKKVDVPNKRMEVVLPPGLLEDDFS